MHDIAIFFQLLPPSCNFPSNYADLISVLWLLVAIVQSHYRISLIAAFNKSYERDYWETTLLLHLDLHFTSMDWGVKLTNKMWISIGKIPVFENVYICILYYTKSKQSLTCQNITKWGRCKLNFFRGSFIQKHEKFNIWQNIGKLISLDNTTCHSWGM